MGNDTMRLEVARVLSSGAAISCNTTALKPVAKRLQDKIAELDAQIEEDQ